MPAYNEEKRIEKTLEEYSDFFNSLVEKNKIEYEIVVVINNTKDKTEDIVREYQKKNKRIHFLNFKRGGKGFAVVEGFKNALQRKNEVIGFVDADMATSPEEYYDLFMHLGKYDGAIADRYLKDSHIEPVFSFRRIFVSRIFNFIVRSLFFFPYRDTQCGAKLFKRSAIKKIIPDLTITQFAFDIDLLYSAKKHGFRIISHPTSWREMGDSTLNIKKASIEMFFAVIQLRILRSRFRRILLSIEPVVSPIYAAARKMSD